MTASATPNIEQLWEDVQATAATLNITCSDDIWPILQTFEKDFSGDIVSMRITSRHENLLNLRYITLDPAVDAYAVAVERGFLTPTEHPVYAVMPKLRELYPDTSSYSLDLDVSRGIQKMWAVFDPPIAPIEAVAEFDFLPDSVRKHSDIFKQYGLDYVSLIGVDFPAKTLNLYWFAVTFPNSPELSANLVMDLGFPRPSQEDCELNATAFTVYTTHSWDSEHIERVSYGMGGPAEAIPARWPEQLQSFAKDAIVRGPARAFTYNTCYGRGIPNYYKLEADYRSTIAQTFGKLLENLVKYANARNVEFTEHGAAAD